MLTWAVREGITNVIRHSGASRCEITLVRKDGDVQLDVIDDGSGAAMAKAGNGLRGLGERLLSRGGRLEAGPLPVRGFRLRVLVPAGKASGTAVSSSGDRAVVAVTQKPE